MKLITGRVERVIERQKTWPDGTPFTDVTLAVADWGSTEYVQLGRDFASSAVPAEGDQVALVVYARTYLDKDGKAACAFNATTRSSEVERKLYDTAPTKLAASA